MAGIQSQAHLSLNTEFFQLYQVSLHCLKLMQGSTLCHGCPSNCEDESVLCTSHGRSCGQKLILPTGCWKLGVLFVGTKENSRSSLNLLPFGLFPEVANSFHYALGWLPECPTTHEVFASDWLISSPPPLAELQAYQHSAVLGPKSVCKHFGRVLPFYSLINDHLHWWNRNMGREALLLQNPTRMFEKHPLKAEDLRTDCYSLSSYCGQGKCEGLARGKKPLKLEGLHSSQMSQVSLLIWNRACRRGTGDVNYARKMEQNSNKPTNGLGRLHGIV